MAERIQLRSTKGWRKPEGAIVVARPSKWGNPFIVGDHITDDHPLWFYVLRTLAADNSRLPWSQLILHDRRVVVDAFSWWLIEQPSLMCSLDELRGHDLACWCPLDHACHADVLLELANQGAHD